VQWRTEVTEEELQSEAGIDPVEGFCSAKVVVACELQSPGGGSFLEQERGTTTIRKLRARGRNAGEESDRANPLS